ATRPRAPSGSSASSSRCSRSSPDCWRAVLPSTSGGRHRVLSTCLRGILELPLPLFFLFPFEPAKVFSLVCSRVFPRLVFGVFAIGHVLLFAFLYFFTDFLVLLRMNGVVVMSPLPFACHFL